jgi:uroporphyrinogen-III synthase
MATLLHAALASALLLSSNRWQAPPTVHALLRATSNIPMSDLPRSGSIYRRCAAAHDRPSSELCSSSSALPTTPETDHSSASLSRFVIGVALTREAGQNGKLRQALEAKWAEKTAGESQGWFRLSTKDGGEVAAADDMQQVPTLRLYEMPCITHGDGPDADQLPVSLTQQPWTWIAITSPEAARVFGRAWKTAKENGFVNLSTGICAVGKATAEVLSTYDISVQFTPSKANAETLVKELPQYPSSLDGITPPSVLYPASKQAAPTLAEGLSARGFQVTRLDTYDTVPYIWNKNKASDIDVLDDSHPTFDTDTSPVRVVCFGSPSAVRGWSANTQGNKSNDASEETFVDVQLAACIGHTSAAECRRLGWRDEHIFYPQKPGVPGWADSVQDAVQFYLDRFYAPAHEI